MFDFFLSFFCSLVLHETHCVKIVFDGWHRLSLFRKIETVLRVLKVSMTGVYVTFVWPWRNFSDDRGRSEKRSSKISISSSTGIPANTSSNVEQTSRIKMMSEKRRYCEQLGVKKKERENYTWEDLLTFQAWNEVTNSSRKCIPIEWSFSSALKLF